MLWRVPKHRMAESQGTVQLVWVIPVTSRIVSSAQSSRFDGKALFIRFRLFKIMEHRVHQVPAYLRANATIWAVYGVKSKL
jgi:hypothetical protein